MWTVQFLSSHHLHVSSLSGVKMSSTNLPVPASVGRTRTWNITISWIPNRQGKKSRMPCLIFGESCFLGRSQIPFSAKIFSIFPNPSPYFGQIADPKNTLPDPVQMHLSWWKLDCVHIADCIFAGELLQDEKTLASYGIQDGFTVYVVKKWPDPELLGIKTFWMN